MTVLRRLCVLCLALALGACAAPVSDFAGYEAEMRARGYFRTDLDPPDAPFREADLVRNFERIAFFLEHDPLNFERTRRSVETRLWKWRPAITYSFVGADFRRQDVHDTRDLMDRLEAVSDVRFRYVEDEPMLYIMILNAAERAEFAADVEISPFVSEWLVSENAPCVATSWTTADDLARAPQDRGMVLIRAEVTGLFRKSCLHEEITQALGLGNDHPEVRPTLFNDDEEFALLTRHDEYLFRILYDPRLRVGMRRSEAMPLVRRIVAELRL